MTCSSTVLVQLLTSMMASLISEQKKMGLLSQMQLVPAGGAQVRHRRWVMQHTADGLCNLLLAVPNECMTFYQLAWHCWLPYATF